MNPLESTCIVIGPFSDPDDPDDEDSTPLEDDGDE